jgi:hypothetical protein
MGSRITAFFALLLLQFQCVSSFLVVIPSASRQQQASSSAFQLCATLPNQNDVSSSSRRDWLKRVVLVASSSLIASSSTPSVAVAQDTTTITTAQLQPLEMKTFVDPQGLFALRVPSNFYTLRRTVKGDLPDAKTGKGRRGSSIFTAGNMAKAEVIAVER